MATVKAGVLALDGARAADMVQSRDGTRLYVAGDDGAMRIYDTATGDLLQTTAVGTRLGAIDLSADGSFAIVTELEPLATVRVDPWWDYKTTAAVYRIDLATGARTVMSTELTGSNYGFADVAVLADGTALLTGRILPGWSGGAAGMRLDTATGVFTPLPAISAYDGASLTVGTSRTDAVLGELNLSSAVYRVFDQERGIVADNGIYENGVYGYAAGIDAYSEAADRIAIYTGGALHLYTGNLGYLANLTEKLPAQAWVSGLAFSADGRSLFVVDQANKAILEYAVSDMALVQRTAFASDSAPTTLAWGAELIVSDDRDTFWLTTETGVIAVDNPAIVRTRTGTAGDDTIDDSFGANILAGLGGNDALSGNAGADRIEGGDGNDRIDGGAGADTLDGGLGDDSIAGGEGNDRIDGGAGSDVVLLGGILADYRSVVVGDTIHLLSATDGIDRITGVETFRVDGSDRDAAAFVAATQSVPDGEFLFVMADRGQGAIGGVGQVVGSDGLQDVRVLDGSRIVLDPSFNRGGDRVHLSGEAGDYVAWRTGSSVEISDGRTSIVVPGGLKGIDIHFADGVRQVYIDANTGTLRIGTQAIDGTPTTINIGAQAPTSIGMADGSVESNLVMFAGGKATAEGHLQVFGTAERAEHVTLGMYTNATFDASFNAGGDTITMPKIANAYWVQRSGSTIVLFDDLSTAVRVPIGLETTTIAFGPLDLALRFDSASGTVRLGSTEVGSLATQLGVGLVTATPDSLAMIV